MAIFLLTLCSFHQEASSVWLPPSHYQPQTKHSVSRLQEETGDCPCSIPAPCKVAGFAPVRAWLLLAPLHILLPKKVCACVPARRSQAQAMCREQPTPVGILPASPCSSSTRPTAHTGADSGGSQRASARPPAALEQAWFSIATCHLAPLFHLGRHQQPPAEGGRWG